MKQLIFAAMLAMFLLTACGEESMIDPQSIQSESAILQAINADASSNIDILSDEDMEADSADVGTVLAKGIRDRERIHRWGKFIDSTSVDYDVTWVNDDTALVTINRTLYGTFRMAKLDTLADSIYVVEKPFTATTQRMVEAVLADTADTSGWMIVRSSFLVGGTSGSDGMFNSLVLDRRGGTDSVSVLYRSGLVFDRENLPLIQSVVPYRIYAELAGCDSDFVHFEYGLHRQYKFRRPLNDFGIWPDETAGDDIFTGRTIFVQHDGFHRAVLGVITAESLLDDSAPFEFYFWSFPYRIE